MTKRVSLENSAMAVVFYKGRILATMEEIYGKVALSLPKGHIEAGETITEAAIRECFEETNVIITPSDAKGKLPPFEYSFTRPDGRAVVKTVTPIVFETKYKCNPKPNEVQIKSVEYLDVDEFLINCEYDNVKQAVQSALRCLQ